MKIKGVKLKLKKNASLTTKRDLDGHAIGFIGVEVHIYCVRQDYDRNLVG